LSPVIVENPAEKFKPGVPNLWPAGKPQKVALVLSKNQEKIMYEKLQN